MLLGTVVVMVLTALVGAAGRASAVEQAPYRVESVDGDYEVRDYPATVMAEVTRAGSRGTAVGSAFRTLADYIFAKDRTGAKIPMTAPVTQSPDGATTDIPATTRWTVRFVMPGGSRLDSLPPPTGDVRLVDAPPVRVAAYRFSGRWTDAKFEAAEGSLRAWMARRDLIPAGQPTFAYYDPPFKPWFLRRNEVLIPIRFP